MIVRQENDDNLMCIMGRVQGIFTLMSYITIITIIESSGSFYSTR
jgi:hypothetical protein